MIHGINQNQVTATVLSTEAFILGAIVGNKPAGILAILYESGILGTFLQAGYNVFTNVVF